MRKIPVCEPSLHGNELNYVIDAVKSSWIASHGTYLDQFESKFARFSGTTSATSVSNGTAALHLACLALGVASGDEVIIPNFTMIASAFAVCYTGAKPVFVDAERETWNIDPDLIEAKITPRTKAIMVVHIYGHPCDMDAISALARKHNLPIIEDAAEAHGGEYGGRQIGSLGDIACFSLFANKIITSGEGGVVVTRDPELMDRVKYFKNLCFPLNGPRIYQHEDIGFNYRMTNVQAAIALAQLEAVEDLVTARRKNAEYYKLSLSEVPGLRLQPEIKGSKNVYWMNGVVVEDDFGISRDKLRDELLKRGIDTRNFFYPMHRQGALKKFGCDVHDEYPVSDWLSERGFYLPSGSSLTDYDLEYIVENIKQIFDFGKKL